jgi:hypothetical protein
MKWFLSLIFFVCPAALAFSTTWNVPIESDAPILAAKLIAAASDPQFIEAQRAFREAAVKADPNGDARPETWRTFRELSRAFDGSRDRKNATGVPSGVKGAFLQAVVKEESVVVTAAWHERLMGAVVFGAGGMFSSGCLFLIAACFENRVKRRIARQVPAVSGRTWFGLLEKLIERTYHLDRELAALRYVQVDNRRLKFELEKKRNSPVEKSQPAPVETITEGAFDSCEDVGEPAPVLQSPMDQALQPGLEVSTAFTTQRGFAAVTLDCPELKEGDEDRNLLARVTSELSRTYVESFFEEEPSAAQSDFPPEVQTLIEKSSYVLQITSNNLLGVEAVLHGMCVSEDLIAIDNASGRAYWSIAGKDAVDTTGDDAQSYIDFFRNTWDEQNLSASASLSIEIL